MTTGRRPLPMLDSLPIDAYIPEIIAVLRSSSALVLTAPPGSGKTTRIPRALYDEGLSGNGEILILEPRRLAARLAATRVAQELGEKVGDTVGYSIRFENVAGPNTRIRFLTEAILARRMVTDPNLEGVSAVILDEFHERHLATDLALAFLKRLQNQNAGLKTIVMSATLDAGPVVSFLSNARLISIEEAAHALEIEFEERAGDRPLHDKVVHAVSKLLRSGLDGDVLAFLPGSAEIRRCAEALASLAKRSNLQLLPLHGDLPLSEQKRAMEPSAQTKVILATNVAETSVTIPGISAVIDSGLARIAGHSPWSGFPTLATAKISQASAIQRAGRAGRTRAGRVLRLYTRPDFESRAAQGVPEIRRTDLAETALMLHGADVRDIASFPWFEAPPKPALEAADALLIKLGAIDERGSLSGIGRLMLEIPAHPRLARLIVEGEKLKVARESVALAALLSERDIRLDARAVLDGMAPRVQKHASGPSDLLELLERFREAEDARFAKDRVRELGLDYRAVNAVRRGQQQFLRILCRRPPASAIRPAPEQREEALQIAILTAFPDRVAKRRRAGSRELLLAGGGSAILSPASVVHNPMFLVAIDAEERKSRLSTQAPETLVRLASGVEIEWLAAFFPDAISETKELIWNDRAGRVDEVKRTEYGQISLEETIKPASPSKEASALLASAVFDRRLSWFRDSSSLSSFHARIALLARHFPDEKWPASEEKDLHHAVAMACREKCRMDEIEPVTLMDVLMEGLTSRQRSLLIRETPERIKLKSGRSVRIHYDSSKPPWIESRLQDFFGTSKTPAICGGRESLTIHLLAPNGRAVQVTQDLAGFWQKHYPSIRQELQRRYPKHAWPESGSLPQG